jgi:hypothetical protein
VSIFDKLKSLLGGRPPANANAQSPEPEREEPARGTTAQEDARTEAEARSLFDAGEAAEAIALLSRKAILFARHEPGSALPCLCRRCLVPDVRRAESGGVAYDRDFVVSWHRALFYWAPSELAASARQLRASMRAALRQRLRLRTRKSDEPRQGINPFTKQPITIVPRGWRRRRTNPFTGKPIP